MAAAPPPVCDTRASPEVTERSLDKRKYPSPAERIRILSPTLSNTGRERRRWLRRRTAQDGGRRSRSGQATEISEVETLLRDWGGERVGRRLGIWGIAQDRPGEGHRGSPGPCTCSEHPPRSLLCPLSLLCNPDINELNLPKTCDISFSDPDDLLNFKLVICPDEGFYKSGKFVFSFKVGQGYPHDPPKVKCETMVYHPNIDLEGNVCLNILREDWKPVLTINSIIYGLQYLFLEPNPEDPLNKEAAEVLQNNRRLFEQNVQRSMRGGYIGSTYFERCLK
ncbi:NEDD8-conjugating enzyme Ubc12 [Pteropus alecto]|uniref:NEDD8-conjugating enzyme Ubc12 n=1 Tax=Pteropus alecto TaxID=9402 RepID=UPI0003F148CB|nr:NEDD8-conjugating enzyme Ubc12 [Pteropus alecto]